MKTGNCKMGARLRLIVSASGALAFTSYLLSCFLVERYFGFPSSTSSLVILFIPVYAAVGALIGLVVGQVVKFVADAVLKKTMLSPSVVLRAVFFLGIVVLFLAGYFGYFFERKYIRQNTPGIVCTEDVVRKCEVWLEGGIKDSSKIIKESDEDTSISWNNQTLKLRFDEHSIYIWDQTDILDIKTSLRGYDYINELQVIEVALFPPEEKRCLAVFAKLRATSRNAMLLIYSPEGVLLYEELIGKVFYTANISTEKIPNSNLEKLFFDYSGEVENEQPREIMVFQGVANEN